MNIRKAMLAVAASAALVATLIACAQDGHRDAPVAATVSPSPVSNLPPAYLGAAYSAAIVYSYIRPSSPRL